MDSDSQTFLIFFAFICMMGIVPMAFKGCDDMRRDDILTKCIQAGNSPKECKVLLED